MDRIQKARNMASEIYLDVEKINNKFYTIAKYVAQHIDINAEILNIEFDINKSIGFIIGCYTSFCFNFTNTFDNKKLIKMIKEILVNEYAWDNIQNMESV